MPFDPAKHRSQVVSIDQAAFGEADYSIFDGSSGLVAVSEVNGAVESYILWQSCGGGTHIRSMATVPAARKCGLASALLRSAVEAYGWAPMSVTVEKHGPDAEGLLRFYGRHGFRHTRHNKRTGNLVLDRAPHAYYL